MRRTLRSSGERFDRRVEAGRALAERLRSMHGRSDVVVVGLPRGGVPVAAEVAAAIRAPLDVIVVRKLGVPSQPELAMGAIGEGGAVVIDQDVIDATHVDRDELEQVEQRERATVEARVAALRGGRPRVDLSGRTVVVVDDGVATGSTARAACQVARRAGADRIVVATPVAPPGWGDGLADVADETVAVATPGEFRSVGSYYRDFTQVTDDEVVETLRAHRTRSSSS